VQNSESSGLQHRRQSSITYAKNELLNDLDSEQRRAKNISLQSLLWVYIVLLFVLLLILPKIYISNQIYYISKDINTKYHKYTALLEENRLLKKKIEQLNYERNVLDDVAIP
jgi:cell division protein FtsB